MFAFLDDHSRLLPGYRFGFAEDTVRLAAALEPALAARGVPEAVYVDNGSAFVEQARSSHAETRCPPGAFDTTPPAGQREDRTLLPHRARPVPRRGPRHQRRRHRAGRYGSPVRAAGAERIVRGLGRNRIPPPHPQRNRANTAGRWDTGWERLGRAPAIPTAPDLTEAFLWSEHRTVTKTGTISLHSNTYQVDPALAGRRVELVFSPFDMETIDVRYRDRSYGKALPHNITRHTHPKARPEIPTAQPQPSTGIDYLKLTAEAHHEQIRREARIGYDALYHPDTTTNDDQSTEGQELA